MHLDPKLIVARQVEVADEAQLVRRRSFDLKRLLILLIMSKGRPGQVDTVGSRRLRLPSVL